MDNQDIFDLQIYLDNIKQKIISILSSVSQNELTYDILDTEKTKQYKLIALKEKQRQMKIGRIFQMVLGNYDKFNDLGIGHETGLDVISYDRKIIIELKNRTNTDNSSSKKANLDKLANFKKKNPDYECIYGCINDDTEIKTLNGKINTILHNNVEIKMYVGYELLRHILGKNTDIIIDYVKNVIDENIIL
jgi:hypothetical protein